MKTLLLVKKNFNNNTFLLLVNFFLLLVFFSQLHNINIGHFFNSDSLYLPSVYRDLFVYKNTLEGWHLNPAPNFFPDMFFYFILMFLCGNNFIITSFLFAFIQYFVFLYLLVRLFKIILPGQSPKFHAIIYFIPTLCLLAVFYLHGIYIFAYFLLSNSYHTGSFLMALLSFGLALNFFKGGYSTRAVFLFVLAVVAVFCDKLYLASFIAPAIFASLFFIRKHLKKALSIIFISVLATLLGLYLFNHINQSGYLYFDAAYINIDKQNMIDSFNTLCRLLKEYVDYFGYHTLTLYLFVISIIGLVYLLFKKWNTSAPVLKFALLFILAQSVSITFAPVVGGNFTGSDTFRYNLYPVYLGGLNLAIFLALTLQRTPVIKLTYKYSTLALILLVFAGGIFKFEPAGLSAFFNYYPETARKLDLVAEKDGLLQGVGNYWYAKYVTMFSKKGVRVRAAFEDLAAYTHVANENWFFDPKNKFNFVLLNDVADTALYRKNIKYSTILHNEPDLWLVKTNMFEYDRSTYLPKK